MTNDYLDKEYLDQFLDETEQAKLSQFVMDEKMREAVKKVILFSIYNCGVITKGKPHRPMINFALTVACQKGAKYEDIGRDIKSCWEGINIVKNAFDDMLMSKLEPVPEIKPNQAR